MPGTSEDSLIFPIAAQFKLTTTRSLKPKTWGLNSCKLEFTHQNLVNCGQNRPDLQIKQFHREL